MPSKAKLLSFRPFGEVHSLELSENITASGVPEIGCSLYWNPMTDWLGVFRSTRPSPSVYLQQASQSRHEGHA